MMSKFLIILGLLPGVLATCGEYYGSSKSVAAKRWCNEGSYFNYTSGRNGVTSQVFYRCSGNSAKQALVMGHGWPTSSFDFQKLAGLLDEEYYVCAVDYVGHGFSDKPADKTYSYSMFEHAEVVEKLVTDVVPLSSFTYIAHDEGDSVAFILLSRYEQEKKPFNIEHIVILNGGIYLPLQNIAGGQKRLLSNITGPIEEKLLSGTLLAHGLGLTCYSPKLSGDEISELASVFDYQKGCHVLHGTIQYLNERWAFEDQWLAMLSRSSVPATMIWGDADPAAPVKEGQYVWDKCLSNRTTPATFHIVPGASHYVHVDHAEVVADIVRNATRLSSPISV